jgi:hypothetical protein
MRRSFLAAAIVPAVAFAAVTFGSTKEAAAGPTIDLGLNLGTAFQTGRATSHVDFSLGGNAAFGYRFNIPRSYVYVQPEIGGGYMRFGFNSAFTGGYDYAGTLNTGLKFGLQGLVQPNVFAHLGVGFLGREVGPNTVEFNLGPQLDIGGGLDIRPVPGFTIGAQLAYNAAPLPSQPYDAAKWLTFGVKVGFQFGEPRPRRVYVRHRRYY